VPGIAFLKKLLINQQDKFCQKSICQIFGKYEASLVAVSHNISHNKRPISKWFQGGGFMASCYFCGCSIRNGEGYRRKVLTSESARVYITKRGGGSYGQTYALRTLCVSCSAQLDERNKRLSWQLPVSIVAGLIGTIIAVRWAVADHSETSGLGSLIYAFFLFGGLGFITYFGLKFLANDRGDENASISYENSSQNYEPQPSYEPQVSYGSADQLLDTSNEDEFADYKESIMQLAMELGDLGISLQGIYGLPHTLESWIAVNDKILETLPPKQYPSKNDWEKYLKKRVFSKFHTAVSSNEVPAKNLAFPYLEDEDEDSYTARLNNAIGKTELL
jgi:hypothetical protein